MRAYLELLRPANVATALADVMAGYAVAGLGNHRALGWLLLATACLYAGGVVLNDFFDRDLDRVERPERPIPSGRVRPAAAARLGAGLLAAGVIAASLATAAAAALALGIAALAVAYDAWGKHHLLVAPVNMGACRALNLLLGMAAAPAVLGQCWPLAIVPLLYVGAVTLLSRGEVHGGARGTAAAALVLLGLSLAALAFVATKDEGTRLPALALAAALALRVGPPFWRAWRTPSAPRVRTAVLRGVLSLVLVDATIAAAYAGPLYAALVLGVGVAAGLLARLFAVT